jgi:hypothetical protein
MTAPVQILVFGSTTTLVPIRTSCPISIGQPTSMPFISIAHGGKVVSLLQSWLLLLNIDTFRAMEQKFPIFTFHKTV